MLREQNRLIVKAHKLLDISLTSAAFIAAYFIKREFLPTSLRGLSIGPNYYVILLLVIIFWYLSFNFFNLYTSYRKQQFRRIFIDTVKAVSAGAVFLSLFIYLFKVEDVSRLMMFIFLILNIGFLCLSKGLVYLTLRYFRRRGYNFRNILIVGSGKEAVEIFNTVKDHPELSYRVLGCLETDSKIPGENLQNGMDIIGSLDEIGMVLRKHIVDELIFSVSSKKLNNVNEYIAIAEEMGVKVRFFPNWWVGNNGYNPKVGSFQIEEFMGIPTLALFTTPSSHDALFFKTLIDLWLSVLSLVCGFPLLIIIAIAVKVSSKGPIFYKQKRLGLNGRRFVVYKFRTMLSGAEENCGKLSTINESDGPAFKIKKDPRIIPVVGLFLRKTGLDELPQLLNVIKGDMSLVGPRPPLQKEVEKYDFRQRRRLSMKPGLTCLWQIAPNRNDISFSSWMKLDLFYIDNWSLWLDMKILFKTMGAVLRGSGR